MSLRLSLFALGAVASGLAVPPAFGQTALRLNNLVSELLRAETVRPAEGARFSFRNLRPGWVFFSLRADVRAGERVELIRDGAPLLTISPGLGPSVEGMWLLPAGEHTLLVRSRGAASAGPLIVRAVPETQFMRYPNEPRIPEQGKFTWDWLKRNVFGTVNTIACVKTGGLDQEIDDWTRSGRKMISYGGLPHEAGLTGPQVFQFWLQAPGFQDPRLSGMIADEFSGRQHPLYPSWIEGMRMLGEKMKGTGKAFYAYTGGPGMYTRPESRELVRTVIDSGFYMAWERYHHEVPDESDGREYMGRILGKEIVRWRAAFPRLMDHLVMVLGIFMTGPELNVQPDVNYKVWMDMQLQYLATHPGFDGLFGVQWWYSGGATEEILRWENALYRHYCINGATDLLSRRYGWTYRNEHIANPDFLDELRAWDALPAGTGSIKTGYLERYAAAQNRYWQRGAEPDDPSGNGYLWMKRQAAKPNRVSQQVRGLAPGRLYSVELITADYQDIRAGRSAETKHAVSIAVEGAERVAQGSYFSALVRSPYSHAQLPFANGPAIFNHHRLMFRATAPSARLVISDWASDQAAGGPEGQELMFNYVQLEPYFEGR